MFSDLYLVSQFLFGSGIRQQVCDSSLRQSMVGVKTAIFFKICFELCDHTTNTVQCRPATPTEVHQMCGVVRRHLDSLTDLAESVSLNEEDHAEHGDEDAGDAGDRHEPADRVAPCRVLVVAVRRR